MIRKRTAALALALATLATLTVHSQNLSLRIDLYDEQVYFPDSRIEVHVTLENDTPQAVRFRLATERLFNLSFEVRTDRNETLPVSEDFSIARSQDQVFYRTVTLESGERLSFIETLGDYVSIPSSGLYTVQARFYPGLHGYGNENSVYSNPIVLHVRPGATPEIREQQRFDAIVDQRLQREDISPDRVVSYTISALQEENWERFFLYLDIERLYTSIPSRKNVFDRLSERDQIELLAQYRDELRMRAVDRDSTLVMIPDDFRILETNYSPTLGTVRVMAYYNMGTFRERREYVYDLERRNGFWEIVEYSVNSLANEALPQ